MIIGFKDAAKFFGIAIIACCAVLVCNMFLNYDIDLRAVSSLVSEDGKRLYDALLTNNKVVCLVSGACLVLTAVVMLVFYIGQYIDAHSDRFGILKALGYSDGEIAVRCSVFGFCVFLGTAVGYALSWAIMPKFYELQNNPSEGLPTVVLHYNPVLLLLIILPTVVFSALSVGIAFAKLKTPVLNLIKGVKPDKKVRKYRERRGCKSFLSELSLTILGGKKSLAFFVAFGGFCFSAMTQMGVSMDDYTKGDMMGAMILIIGLILAAVSLYLAMSTVIGGNAKTLAMLKTLGYGVWERSFAVLGLYRIPAYIGFAVGSVYQWGILNVMVNFVFKDLGDVPVYSFDWATFGICIAVFFAAYALLNLTYTYIVGRMTVKSVMSE